MPVVATRVKNQKSNKWERCRGFARFCVGSGAINERSLQELHIEKKIPREVSCQRKRVRGPSTLQLLRICEAATPLRKTE
jgi:hypothetical protein